MVKSASGLAAINEALVEARGVDLFGEARQRDLEGSVAKWKHGPYHTDGVQTSWLKIKNAGYSQMRGRRKLFERRRDRVRPARPRRWPAPVVSRAR